MKRAYLNLILLALALGLAAALYFTREREEAGPPLTSLQASEISRIRLEHPQQPVVALEKRDGHWRLVEPVQASADALEVGSILQLATMPVRRSLTVSEVDLAELKLEPPQYRVQLDDTVLAIGDREPIGFRRYIRNGDTVALTDDLPSAALDADYADLVAKELLPPDARIRRIEVPGLTAALADDGRWQLTPAQPDAGADQIQAFVDGWRNARAMWNGTAPAGEAARAEPVRIVLEGDQVVELRIVAREPQLVLENPATRVRHTLSKSLENEILRLPPPAADSAPQPPTAGPSP